MASLVLIARLAVQKQSFFNILGQTGRRVTKVYFRENVHGKSRKVIRDMINTLFNDCS